MKSLGNITTEFKSAKKRPTGIFNLPASGLRATISLKEIANDKHPVTFAVHDHRTKESYRRLLTGNKHRVVDSVIHLVAALLAQTRGTGPTRDLDIFVLLFTAATF